MSAPGKYPESRLPAIDEVLKRDRKVTQVARVRGINSETLRVSVRQSERNLGLKLGH